MILKKLCLYLPALLWSCGGPSSTPPPDRAVPSSAGTAVSASDTEAQLTESLTQAIEAAESILKLSPRDPDALLAAALASEHLGQADLAVRYYARLHEVTRETEHLLKLADLTRRSDVDAAVRYASQFFEQGGSDDELKYWLIRRHAERKNLRAAFELTESLKAPADRYLAEFLRDLCFQYARLTPPSSPEALTALRRASLFAPLPTNYVETAALSFLAGGDAGTAEAMLKTFPGPAFLARAKVAEQAGHVAEALTYRMNYFNSGGSDPKELLDLLEGLGRSAHARPVADRLWYLSAGDPAGRLQAARSIARFYRESSADSVAEIAFLEEARDIGDPAFLDRLAELQRSAGNARRSFEALKERYPLSVPKEKLDLYVSQAMSAGEVEPALRAAESAPQALSARTRRRLSNLLTAHAESELAAGRESSAKLTAVRSLRLSDDADGRRMLARIEQQFGDTAAALSHLQAAVKISPADPQANLILGKILFSRNQWAEARPRLQAARDGRAIDADLPFMLGRILFQQGEHAGAWSALHEYAVSQNDQVPPSAQEMLGHAALASGRPAEAAVWLEKRLASGPDELLTAELLESLAAANLTARALGAARRSVAQYPASRRILEAAEAVFDLAADSPMRLRALESLAALTPDPEKKYPILRRLLDAQLELGLNAEADATLTPLLARYPNDPGILSDAWKIRKGTPAVEPILNRLAALRSPGDPIQLVHARKLADDAPRRIDEALRVVREYRAVHKDDPEAMGLEAELWIKKDRPAEAAAAYRALWSVRKDAASRSWLIRHLHDVVLAAAATGKIPDQLEALYLEATQLLGPEEKHQDLYELFAKLFDRKFDRSRAIDALRREFHLTPESDRARRQRLSELLGRWYFADAQTSLAKEMFDLSRQAGNTSSGFLRSHAALLDRMGDRASAAELHLALLKDFPFDRDANFFLARYAADRGKLSEALPFLESLRSASPNDSAVLSALGSAYTALGRVESAVAVWRNLSGLTGNPRVLARYADALHQSGDLQGALREYRGLSALNILSTDQLRRLAELERTQGNLAHAEKIYLKLLASGGAARDREEFSDILRRMGDAAVQAGSVAEAARIAERLLDLKENDPTSFLLMGKAKLLEGKLEAAIEGFSRARSLAPADPRPLVGLAEVELRKNRPAAAIDYARKALAMDRNSPEAHSLIGLAYQRQGDVKNAYASLKEAIQFSKNRAAAHVRMGDLFLNNSKYHVALQQYRRAIEIDPNNARARLANAQALHKLGFSENAMKELLKVVDLDPDGAGREASALLADIFVAHDDAESARRLLEAAASKPAAPPGVLIRLGEMYRQAGNPEKGLRLFKEALVSSDDLGVKYDSLNALGLALIDLKQPAVAEKTFREAVGLMPNRPEAFLNLSLFFRDRKEFLAAVDHARKAIEAAPSRPEGYKLLGLIYYEAGWRKESLSAFGESLKRNPDQSELLDLVSRITDNQSE